MSSNAFSDERLVYIRETLSNLSRLANAEGYRMLGHLIGIACLEAWEMERGLTGNCEEQEEASERIKH